MIKLDEIELKKKINKIKKNVGAVVALMEVIAAGVMEITCTVPPTLSSYKYIFQVRVFFQQNNREVRVHLHRAVFF